MSLEEIPVQIEFGGGQISGSIVKINPTGMLVMLEKVPFQVGNSIKATFTLEESTSYTVEARPIKIYDNYKKRVRIETEDGPAIEEQVFKLSELHFVNPSEELRSGVMKHLMDLQVNLLKKSK